jgi:hypothetical protein
MTAAAQLAGYGPRRPLRRGDLNRDCMGWRLLISPRLCADWFRPVAMQVQDELWGKR